VRAIFARAGDDELTRPDERLDVDVHSAFRYAGHRHDHMVPTRLEAARIRPNGHDATFPCREDLERLRPDDFVRAGAADKSFHAAARKDHRMIAQV
jgi:hypothetical protein